MTGRVRRRNAAHPVWRRDLAIRILARRLLVPHPVLELLGAARLQHAIDTLDGEACRVMSGDLAERIDAAFVLETTPWPSDAAMRG